jgi:N6-adenosine-specific RNA methylase IME4
MGIELYDAETRDRFAGLTEQESDALLDELDHGYHAVQHYHRGRDGSLCVTCFVPATGEQWTHVIEPSPVGYLRAARKPKSAPRNFRRTSRRPRRAARKAAASSDDGPSPGPSPADVDAALTDRTADSSPPTGRIITPVTEIGGYPVHPSKQYVPMLGGDALDALTGDINNNGQKMPIIVVDGMVIDGRARLLACLKLGIEPRIEVWQLGADKDAYALVGSLDLHRRHLEEGQHVYLGWMLYQARPEWQGELERRRIEANQRRSQSMLARTHEGVTPGGGESGRLCKDVAKLYGFSPRSSQRMRRLLDSPHRDAVIGQRRYGLLDGVIAGKLALEAADREISVLEGIAKFQDAGPLPAGLFGVVVMDPPWLYANATDIPYPTQPLGKLKERIAELKTQLAEDATIWIWVPNIIVPFAHEIARELEVPAKSMMTWVKDSPGKGFWLREDSEQCLLCIKGHPTHTLPPPTTTLHAPRPHGRGHSSKPDEFFRLVEATCADPRRLYMYAGETKIPGWECWSLRAPRVPGTGVVEEPTSVSDTTPDQDSTDVDHDEDADFEPTEAVSASGRDPR